jgi:hypothetical protein
MNLSAYASGYKRLYGSDEEELAACLDENAKRRGGGIATADPSDPYLHWWPSSLDFVAEAVLAPPAVPVRDFGALLVEIRKRKALETVFCYAHGARDELQFGAGNKLTIGEISVISNADASASFAGNGKIVFVACNLGLNGVFLQAIANALRVPVEGFPRGVEWRLQFVGLAPHRKITRRGLADRDGTLRTALRFNPQR